MTSNTIQMIQYIIAALYVAVFILIKLKHENKISGMILDIIPEFKIALNISGLASISLIFASTMAVNDFKLYLVINQITIFMIYMGTATLMLIRILDSDIADFNKKVEEAKELRGKEIETNKSYKFLRYIISGLQLIKISVVVSFVMVI